jgi:hypothetical protein
LAPAGLLACGLAGSEPISTEHLDNDRGLRELSRNRHRLRKPHLMGRMEGNFHFALDCQARHDRPEALLAEVTERPLAGAGAGPLLGNS